MEKCKICGGNNHQCEKSIDYDAAIGAEYLEIKTFKDEIAYN